MKNQKKLIVIISKFPKILYMITKTLRDETVDFILDASKFSQPVSLLRITNPDNLLLNLGLSSGQAIELVGKNMSESMQIKKGMIIGNPKAYYMSLCSTFISDYAIERNLDIELIPGAISKQQLN
jgi:predicted nucleotide-binding protein (sugar kinase/HSP70/actin superfamily)